MFRSPIMSARDWSQVALAWHLTWPGWLAGVALLTVGGLTPRQAIFAIFTMVAIGRALRLWSLSHDRLKLIPQANTNTMLRLASRVTLLEILAFGGSWLGWQLMQLPRTDPDGMVLQALLIPWPSLFFVVSSLQQQERNATDL
jgi:hypothetical protein